MKIEIADNLFNDFKNMIKDRLLSDNVAEEIENLIRKKLHQSCFLGYELDGLTKLKTRFQLAVCRT